MADLNVRIRTPSGINIKVSNTAGFIQPSGQVPSFRTDHADLPSVLQLQDVDASNVAAGATLVYNSTTNTYEVRPLTSDDLPPFGGTIELIDGGTF